MTIGQRIDATISTGRRLARRRGFLILAVTAVALPLLLPIHATYQGSVGDGVNAFGGRADCGPPIAAAFGLGVDQGRSFQTLAGVVPPPTELHGDSKQHQAEVACLAPARRRLAISGGFIVLAIGAFFVARGRRRRKHAAAVLTAGSDQPSARFPASTASPLP